MSRRDDPEDELIRSVALQNARDVLAARQRAERELLETKELYARLYEDAKRIGDELRERARHSALAAAAGSAMIDASTLGHKLQRVADSIVEHLDASLARIWTFDDEDGTLVLQASAGPHADFDGDHARVPLGRFQIGRIGETRQPMISSSPDDDPTWARYEDVVSFAGYPLIVGEQLVGVIALFAKHVLADKVVLALEDVAGRVALGIDRARADVERVEQDRFRELFIGMLGHDLRNPLGAVAAGTELLLLMTKGIADGPLPASTIEGVPRALLRMKRSTDRMSRMIEQILEFTRLRVGGGIPVTPRAIDLHDVLRAAVDEVRSSFPDRPIDAEYQGNGRGSWDADRLSQVFSNLMGNAIAYGDATQPIRVTAGEDQDDVVIEVSNAGPVIPAEVLPLIFDPFRRGGHARTNATKGLGLGLYITRQIVVAHGGTIGVQSLDSVTSFKISMPRREGLVGR